MPTMPLKITIRDFVYNANITIPSVPTAPQAPYVPQVPSIPSFTPAAPPSQEVRIVKILPEGERKLPDANSGETVKITATVICKTGETTSRPRDTAYLIVDGAVADRKTIENGIVTFDWQATAVPLNIHTICVRVDPSSSCKSPGQDCKRITVSPTTLGIAEQLSKERASALEQKQLLEQARSRLRGEIIGAELQIPGAEYVPTIPTAPIIVPTVPTTTIPTAPAAPIIEYGEIQIIGLPAPLSPISAEIPVYVYIDDKNVGRISELPKTISNIEVGTHSVYARGGDITLPSKTVIVKKDETTTVTL